MVGRLRLAPAIVAVLLGALVAAACAAAVGVLSLEAAPFEDDLGGVYSAGDTLTVFANASASWAGALATKADVDATVEFDAAFADDYEGEVRADGSVVVRVVVPLSPAPRRLMGTMRARLVSGAAAWSGLAVDPSWSSATLSGSWGGTRGSTFCVDGALVMLHTFANSSASGVAEDEAEYMHPADADVSGARSWSEAGGLSLDAADSRAVVGGAGAARVLGEIASTGAFSVEVWYWPSPVAHGGTLDTLVHVGESGSACWLIALSVARRVADDALVVTMGTSHGSCRAFVVAAALPASAATHVAVTYAEGGAGLRVFVNGTEAFADAYLDGSLQTSQWESADQVWLGNHPGLDGNAPGSRLGRVAVWSAVLPAEVVADAHAAGPGRATCPPAPVSVLVADDASMLAEPCYEALNQTLAGVLRHRVLLVPRADLAGAGAVGAAHVVASCAGVNDPAGLGALLYDSPAGVFVGDDASVVPTGLASDVTRGNHGPAAQFVLPLRESARAARAQLLVVQSAPNATNETLAGSPELASPGAKIWFGAAEDLANGTLVGIELSHGHGALLQMAAGAARVDGSPAPGRRTAFAVDNVGSLSVYYGALGYLALSVRVVFDPPGLPAALTNGTSALPAGTVHLLDRFGRAAAGLSGAVVELVATDAAGNDTIAAAANTVSLTVSSENGTARVPAAAPLVFDVDGNHAEYAVRVHCVGAVQCEGWSSAAFTVIAAPSNATDAVTPNTTDAVAPNATDAVAPNATDAVTPNATDAVTPNATETEIDYCDGVVCANGGDCTVRVNGFLCECTPGWGGTLCVDELDACEPLSPCQNGGECTSSAGATACSCAAGWEGPTCESDVNECQNEGRGGCDDLAACANSPGSWSCGACPDGYTVAWTDGESERQPQQHCLRALAVCDSYEVSELGAETACNVTLARALPEGATLSLQIGTNRESEVEAVSGTRVVTLTSADWDDGGAHRVTVRGVRDETADGNQEACLTARVVPSLSSGAPEFAGFESQPCAVGARPLVNVDIAFPVIETVSPSLVPLVGTNVTVTGRRFEANMTAAVPGSRVPLSLVELAADGSRAVFAAGAAPDESWSDTYRAFWLANADGGRAECAPRCEPEEELYYVDECIPRGQFGSGLTCRPCPTGAVCPGGSRVWPLPGYWASSESDPGSVGRCSPPSEARCAGGRASACGPGYTGAFCDACTLGYYRDETRCLSCRSGSTADLARPFLLSAAVLLSGGLLLAFGRSALPVLFADATMTVQVLLLSTQAISASLDGTVRDVHEVARSCMFAFNFLRVGCEVPAFSLAEMFAASVCVVIAVMLCFVGASLVHQRRHPGSRRVLLGVAVAFHVTYVSFVRGTLQLLRCEKLPDESGERSLRLTYDKSSLCFDATHGPAAVAAFAVVAGYFLTLPALWLHRLRREIAVGGAGGGSGDCPSNDACALPLRYVRPDSWYFNLLEYYWTFVAAALNVYLFDRLELYLTLAFVLSLSHLLHCLWCCPGATLFDNQVYLGTALFRVLFAATAFYAVTDDGGAGGAVLATAVMAVLATVVVVRGPRRARFRGEGPGTAKVHPYAPSNDVEADTAAAAGDAKAGAAARAAAPAVGHKVEHLGAMSKPARPGTLAPLPHHRPAASPQGGDTRSPLPPLKIGPGESRKATY